MKIPVRYSDLDFNFQMHPVTHDISPLIDVRAVANSIKALVMTNKYERPYQPQIYSDVYGSLFDNILPNTALSIQLSIERVLQTYEPRAQDLNVNVTADIDNNAYVVNVQYTIDGYIDVFTTTVFLERVR
jgi:phage baseplate assembly protein W